MFNHRAQQIFVIHPYGAAGGILSNILSLDPSTASQNFKNYSLETKLDHMAQQLSNSTTKNAHTYGIMNFMFPQHVECINNADSAERYVHKGHFYELLSTDAQNLLTSMPNKIGIGINFTDKCVEEFKKLPRGKQFAPDEYSVYYTWIYANLNTLLPAYFNIDCVHTIEFRDLLDTDKFLDHIKYLSDLLNLNINPSAARQLITQWHAKI
jgi:hypothetical protein